MFEGIPSDITGITIIAMIVGGTFTVLKLAFEFASTALKSRLNPEEDTEDVGVYGRRDQILEQLEEDMRVILPLITEPVPNRPGERMIWRETNGKLRDEIRRLSVSIDALTEIIKDIRGASREAANEAREARMTSEKVLTQLLVG